MDTGRSASSLNLRENPPRGEKSNEVRLVRIARTVANPRSSVRIGSAFRLACGVAGTRSILAGRVGRFRSVAADCVWGVGIGSGVDDVFAALTRNCPFLTKAIARRNRFSSAEIGQDCLAFSFQRSMCGQSAITEYRRKAEQKLKHATHISDCVFGVGTFARYRSIRIESKVVARDLGFARVSVTESLSRFCRTLGRVVASRGLPF